MAQGLQNIPLRVPAEWDAAWYLQHIREVLALADIRNASGDGIEITGQSDEAATLTVSEDIQNLLLQPFVLTSPSGFLEFERVLAAGDAIEITDNGAGSTIEVGVEDNSISLGKLLPLSDMGILGNPVDAPGAVQNIQAALDGDVLTRQGTDLVFTNAPLWTGPHRWVDGIAAEWGTDGDLAIAHSGAAGTITNITGALTVSSTAGNLALSAAAGDITFSAPALTDFLFNGETLAEIAQDAVGTILTDSTTIDFTYVDGGPSITASVIQSFAYQWSANHTWADNAEVRLGTGGDGRIYHDATNTIFRNDTGVLKFMDGATQRAEIGDKLFAGLTEAEEAGVTGLGASTVAAAFNNLIDIDRVASTPFVRMQRMQGSYASPTAVTNTLAIFQFQGRGYRTSGGNGFNTTVNVIGRAAEDFTSTAGGSQLEVQLADIGSVTAREVMRLTPAGALAILDGITAPGSSITGMAQIYIDTSDGDLKIRFADGTVKTIVTDT